MTIKAVKLTCLCGKKYVAFQEIHHMYVCPFCKKSGMDWDKDYIRWMGIILEQEYFEPPWFDDEEEYHSALMSWLNDSDEFYTLRLQSGFLYIIKTK